jgi:hypothetical protein
LEYPNNHELRGYVMLMLMRADQNILKNTSLNTSTTLKATSPSQLVSWTTNEENFISTLDKDFTFTV